MRKDRCRPLRGGRRLADMEASGLVGDHDIRKGAAGIYRDTKTHPQLPRSNNSRKVRDIRIAKAPFFSSLIAPKKSEPVPGRRPVIHDFRAEVKSRRHVPVEARAKLCVGMIVGSVQVGHLRFAARANQSLPLASPIENSDASGVPASFLRRAARRAAVAFRSTASVSSSSLPVNTTP